MVATVLRLRYRILGNDLMSSPLRLLGFCLSAGWALVMLLILVATMIAAAVLRDLEFARTLAVLGGSAVVLGWVVAPLLLAGMELTIDAAHLAQFPLRRDQVMRIMTATGLTGLGGIVTVLGALATVILWLRWPLAAVLAIPCVVLAVLTCIVASRVMVSVSAGLAAGRRVRGIIAAVVLAAVILTGPILSGVDSILAGTQDLASRTARMTGVLGWTPVGIFWSAPADAAAGHWGLAFAKVGIAVAVLVLLTVVWERSLASATVRPPQGARRAAAGALGMFGRFPTGGVGATWARSLSNWLRDPRYLRQLIVVPLLPVMFAFLGGMDSVLFAASTLVVALFLCIAGYSDVSYDGTAFASVLSTGVRGVADRTGRVLGAACVGVPIVVMVALVTLSLGGRLAALPAVLGGALGILFAGYAVSAVSSALIVVPVPAPGDPPFKTTPGQTVLSGLVVSLVVAVCAVIAAPSLVPSLVSLIGGDAALGWLSLALAVVVGVPVMVVGIVHGGRTFDRTAATLLARMRAFPV